MKTWQKVVGLVLLVVVVAFLQTLIQMWFRRNITVIRERASVVEVTCAYGRADGPSTVQYAHPRVTISHAGFPFDHWFEVAIEKEGWSQLVQLVSFSGPYEGQDVLRGWIGDIRGGGAYIFDADALYTLRVWRHGYEPMPEFEEEELVFEAQFRVPDCD